MKAGEFPDGAHVLRAKIDMAHPNMIMRDPLLLRIRHAHHYRQGDAWCLYPLYDFAHGLSDAIEGITHSLCSLEFKDNNDIYSWLVREGGFEHPPEQTEFSRLELEYTVLSKRKLLRLVNEGHVAGWDDPRMPTMAGLRRRGVTPEATARVRRGGGRDAQAGADRAGDVRARRAQRSQHARAARDVRARSRSRSCSRTIRRARSRSSRRRTIRTTSRRPARAWCRSRASCTSSATTSWRIRRRSSSASRPGAKCGSATAISSRAPTSIKDAAGEIVELRCTYDPATRGGDSPDGRKVQGTIHWVSAPHALDCEVRLYDKLFTVPDPDAVDDGQDFLACSTRSRWSSCPARRSSRASRTIRSGSRYQFERTGYFISDAIDSKRGTLVFNRTVTLRDTWAKTKGKG